MGDYILAMLPVAMRSVMAMPQAIERMIKAPWISRDVPERVCPSTISIMRPLQNYFQDVLYKLLLFSNFAL